MKFRLSEVYISGQKRGITTQRLKRSLKRRQAIEPIIGHRKSDGLLGRNYLKGTLGDQMNVLLCCAGHNLRLILKRLRFFLSRFLGTVLGVDTLLGEGNSSHHGNQFRCTMVTESINKFVRDSIASNYGMNGFFRVDELVLKISGTS